MPHTHLQLLNDVLVVPLVGSGGDSGKGSRGCLVVGSIPLGSSHTGGTTAEQQADVGVEVHGQRDGPALGWVERRVGGTEGLVRGEEAKPAIDARPRAAILGDKMN